MGFSWPPYFAQCLAWLVVLEACPIGYEVHQVRYTTESPPAFMFLINIKTNQKVAAIFLWMDNVFAVAHHKNIRDQLASNLRKASKHPPKGCHIEWKYVSVSNTATCLGIDFSP